MRYLIRYLLETINAKFYSEAKFGEKIQVYTEGNSGENTFMHAMKGKLDDKLLVAAHTRWKEIT
jgi:hypothetical protein